MIDFIKKAAAYTGAALTLLTGVKACIGATLSWLVFVLIATSSFLVCTAIAWLEVFPRTTARRSRRPSTTDEGSISLSVRLALEQVRFADRNDESIAFEANGIVRQGLDKRCVTYKEYREWRRKNSCIFTAVVNADNTLIGFFDVFPLTEAAATSLLNGTLHEHSLDANAILPSEKNADAKHVYVASIMVNPQQTAFSQMLAREIVVVKCAEFLATEFPPNGQRMVFAYAHTAFGERLLRNAGFQNTILSDQNAQGAPLYELPAAAYDDLVNTFTAWLKDFADRRRGSRQRRRRKASCAV